MAESAPKTQKKENPDYKKMGTEELFFNTIFGEWQAWQKKRDAKKRVKRIKEIQQKQAWEGREETRKSAALALGEINPARLEKKSILTVENKTLLQSIWTMLWTTPFIRSANKLDRRRESAKKTLWEPFTKKTLGDLFKNIGKEITKLY